MSGDRKPANMPDLLTTLLNIETGLYAITHMTRDDFGSEQEADGARGGIHYVALKLERELRTLIDPLTTAGGAA